MRRTPPQTAAARGRNVEDAEPALQNLDRVLEAARATLNDQQAQEANYRDRLYELKQANDAADPFWLILDISRSSSYARAIRETRDGLLAKAKALNPQLTNWDKAIDPTCRVSEISTRSGKKKVRPFQPPLPLLRFLQGEGSPVAGTSQERPERGTEQEESVDTSRSALRVPVEPSPSASIASQNQLPVGAQSRQVGEEVGEAEQQPEVKLTQEMLNDIQDTVRGMKRFLERMEDRENQSSVEEAWGNPETLPAVSRSERRVADRSTRNEEGTTRSKSNSPVYPQSPWASATSPSTHPVSFLKMVGATEMDKEKRNSRIVRPDFSRPPPDLPETDEEEDENCEYFRKMFEEECEEIEEFDLGPDFVYPSQKAFDKYIGEFDFMKHLKHGTLSKFDGTVKGYPTFKKNFFRLVYAQRIGYLHKLLALEYMVPEKLKKEMFNDLDNSPGHFGERIKRLEIRFGGQRRQVQYLMELLAQAKVQYGGKRVPYTELLDLTRHVDSHLSKGPKWLGAADPILVPLRELVPHHIKTGYSIEMKRCGGEETGKGFLKYLLDALAVEINAQETNPKLSESNGEKGAAAVDRTKGDKSRVLGKLYKTKGKVRGQYTSSSSESEIGSPTIGRRNLSSDPETEPRNYAVVTKGRTVDPPHCSCCRRGSHFLYNCYKFVHKMSLRDKKGFVEEEGRCYRCLRIGHVRSNCMGREVECSFCRKSEHHYMLCDLEDKELDADQGMVKVAELVTIEEPAFAEDFIFEALGDSITKKRVAPMQMVLHALDKDGKVVSLNAMSDTGSTHNIIEMAALERMGLSGTRCKYTVTGHGGHTTTHDAICPTLVLCSPDGKSRFPTKFFAYENPCRNMQPEDWSKLKRGWTHLRKLDIPPPAPGIPIEAILGCVSMGLFEPLRPASVKGPGDPVARWTPLGWLVGGRTRPEVDSVEEGQNHAHTGTILVATNLGEQEKKVSREGRPSGEVKDTMIEVPGLFAGMVNH